MSALCIAIASSGFMDDCQQLNILCTGGQNKDFTLKERGSVGSLVVEHPPGKWKIPGSIPGRCNKLFQSFSLSPLCALLSSHADEI